LSGAVTHNLTLQNVEFLANIINNNKHIKSISIDATNFGDRLTKKLFETLTTQKLESLSFGSNGIGIIGVRQMGSFLKNSHNLVSLSMRGNRPIDSACFNIITNSLLDKEHLRRLDFSGCSITDSFSLDLSRKNLRNLELLNLTGNNIGKHGCIILSKQLSKSGCSLKKLYLKNTGIGDEEAKELASSLKHNTNLETINIEENRRITEEGCRYFLATLLDISSANTTYSSNHSLLICSLPIKVIPPTKFVDLVCKLNRESKAEASNTGTNKVVQFYLNSATSKELCSIEEVYYSYGKYLANIDVLLLPKVLSLIASNHDQTELYKALITTAPNLMSCIDTCAMVKNAIDQKLRLYTSLVREVADLSSRMSNLTDDMTLLHHRLSVMNTDDSKQTTAGSVVYPNKVSRGGKRARSS
jgi:Ran GTPase-activating protein (RanGAP) involved in mRNA processing and transport